MGSLNLAVVFLHMSRLFLAILGAVTLLRRGQWRVLGALLTQMGFFGAASLVHYEPSYFLPALPAVCMLIGMVKFDHEDRCGIQ